MGFDAIWISPMVTNTPNGYHGYWLKDLYGFNPNFGTESDLKALIQDCHSRNMFIMLDVVCNHVGQVDMCVPQSRSCVLSLTRLCRDFAQIVPFNNQTDYHDKCQITDFNNATMVEHCRLANLPVSSIFFPLNTNQRGGCSRSANRRTSIKTTNLFVQLSCNGLGH
jgi:alpha-amylase